MKFKLKSPHHAWLLLFGVWLFILSGALSPFFGSPGAWQAFRLKGLLGSQTEKLAAYQTEVERLQTAAQLLEQSRYAQEREVRRVLGYAAPDELIFDFASD